MSDKIFKNMSNKTILHVGFDDTDSPKGMCTTFLAFKMVDYLKSQDTDFVDFPKLIRFNPNVPWKTRGNGAVSFSIKTGNPAKIKNKIKNFVEKFSDVENGANPGLVFLESEKISENFSKFSELAMWQLVNRNNAKKFVHENNLDYFFMGNGQGLVGAIGSIGYVFNDHTLELISYRKKRKFGTKRTISSQSVKDMQEKTFPNTYNNFDDKKNRVMITPHGPDPVFYGIRGENVESLLTAKKIVQTNEKLDGYMIFKSNQGTNDHLKNQLTKDNIKTYSSGWLTGKIVSNPKSSKGGHIFFKISSDEFELDCAVYKETGLVKIASSFISGDKVMLAGGIRKSSKNFPKSLNVELIKILDFAQKKIQSNPKCLKCNKNMKSKGANQGFECIKCGRKSSKKESKILPRKLQKKLFIPQISAHRHLTRPEQRMGITNKPNQFSEKVSWFFRE